ncbi:MAG: sodium:solute symporter family protein, partial [Candidatus Tectomicrobia bacterium]|nr:sodium:solute symporter family protein [Candidatus Tectomicrobia bacterium]
MSVVNFTILLLIVYLVGLKVLSYFAHRISTASSEDYFLAGRNIGLIALVGTTMASIFSTGTVVSSPSEFYRQGSGYFWVFFFAFMPVVYFFLATKMWRLGKSKGYITPGDMLGDFYKSKTVVFWCAAIGLLALLPYAVAQLVAIGKTFESLTAGRITYFWGVTVVSVSIALYMYFGGARAVVWTDMVQGFIFATLLIVAGFMVVSWSGGWDPMISNLTEKTAAKTSFAGKLKWNYYELGLLPLSFSFLPYIWQRMYMARSASHVAKNLLAVPIIFIVLFFTTWVIGTSAHTILPEGLKDADSVLGALFSDNAPYFGAMLLVAAFAAGMSTVDSQLLSAGSLITHDLGGIVRRGERESAGIFLFGKWSTVILMAALYFWALNLKTASILNLIILGISLTIMYIPCVFGMFYWKKATPAGAAWSMGGGLIV